MKPLPDQAVPTAARDPFAAQDDRTPAELGAIRALAAQFDALLDAPPPGPLPLTGGEDDELAITREALPIVGTTQVGPAIVNSADEDDEPAPISVGLESGLADRMRGVLRGVLVRARRNRSRR